MLGGYMVEVDDQQEWDFLLKFLEEHNGFYSTSGPYIGPVSMFLGMEDVDNTNTFTQIHSGQAATFFDWAYQMPSYSGGDCVFVHISDKRMYNDDCVYNNSKARTVCEVDRPGNGGVAWMLKVVQNLN